MAIVWVLAALFLLPVGIGLGASIVALAGAGADALTANFKPAARFAAITFTMVCAAGAWTASALMVAYKTAGLDPLGGKLLFYCAVCSAVLAAPACLRGLSAIEAGPDRRFLQLSVWCASLLNLMWTVGLMQPSLSL